MSLPYESLYTNRSYIRNGYLFMVCPFCFDTRSVHLDSPTWVIVNHTGTQICMNCYVLTRPKNHQSTASVTHLLKDSPWYNEIDRHLEAFRRYY